MLTNPNDEFLLTMTICKITKSDADPVSKSLGNILQHSGYFLQVSEKLIQYEIEENTREETTLFRYFLNNE